MCSPFFTLMRKEKMAVRRAKVSEEDESEEEPTNAFSDPILFCGKIRNLTGELKTKLIRRKGGRMRNDCNNNDRITQKRNSHQLRGDFESEEEDLRASGSSSRNSESRSPFVNRALPPLPRNEQQTARPSSSGLLDSFEQLRLRSGISTSEFSDDANADWSTNRAQSNVELNKIRTETSFQKEESEDLHSEMVVEEARSELTDGQTNSWLERTRSSQPGNLVVSLIGQPPNESTAVSSDRVRPAARLASDDEEMRKMLDYAASIEKVKDCGWYWGPISGDKAEKLLANEPDGSFIVRDSSDEHYIFSLTFKLNDIVRHVRIEHDQGNFSFGSLQKFRSSTIVDFINEAVEHSRSGRFLFFLHRLPVMGPMRVQLLHPVSRFKRVQSLQHLCRFVILRHVRRDLITQLPLPNRVKKYLNTANYYTEQSTSA